MNYLMYDNDIISLEEILSVHRVDNYISFYYGTSTWHTVYFSDETAAIEEFERIKAIIKLGDNQ